MFSHAQSDRSIFKFVRPIYLLKEMRPGTGGSTRSPKPIQSLFSLAGSVVFFLCSLCFLAIQILSSNLLVGRRPATRFQKNCKVNPRTFHFWAKSRGSRFIFEFEISNFRDSMKVLTEEIAVLFIK